MTDFKQEPLPINLCIDNSLMIIPVADEESVADADEPAENCRRDLLASKLRDEQINMYKKHIVNPKCSSSCNSLLTRAIVSDSDAHEHTPSIYAKVGSPGLRRGMSTTSTRSAASSFPSIADLTSDASDSSSSELSSPSPRLVPMFALPFGADAAKDVTIKGHSDDEQLRKAAIQPDLSAVGVTLGRKRCITFACPSTIWQKGSDEKPKIEQPTPIRRQTTLKFACTVKDESKPPGRPSSPPPTTRRLRSPPPQSNHLSVNAHTRRDSSATVVDESKPTPVPAKAISVVSAASSASNIERFYEFASSVDESVHSWMNAAQFPTRLLKPDCLLEKEKEIRKLSQAVEEDDDQADEDDAGEDNDNLEVDDDEEDDGYKEDEEDEEYELWSDSDDGNRSDNEDGFAESDDEDVDYVSTKPGTAIPDRQTDRPTCCRNASDSSLASGHHSRKPGLCSFQRSGRITIRPSTPELPDSTDFVPGTFDEDKVLEDYYLSCMEERKSMKKGFRPQDIDPSFPTDDDDNEDDEEEAQSSARHRRGSMARRNSSASRSPRVSPPSTRRFRSPPPTARRGSRGMSPNKRRPSFSARSPPPQGRVGRLRFDFGANRSSLARSASMPRHGLCTRKKVCHTTSTSPKPSKAITFRKRGALDIVKGLERKRMRRREHVYGRPREYRAEAGEGVERMREVGMMGKERGAAPPAKWMMSV
ncbi:hypothetical protein DRE_07521 [Drechslerella stenobrocha 248]|uniref:Uncharacterized protein n=1 Tax=Drechslerella stenobrocha 248 TaxID=1043628 RepID=W7HKG7_9PEZI|nr:hypothetical protein DRE_07521 [Drechslerella stenobrocha 248]